MLSDLLLMKEKILEKIMISLILKNRTSVKKTLKCFLEIPDVLDEIVQYQNDIVSSDLLTNILQDELWKEIILKY